MEYQIFWIELLHDVGKQFSLRLEQLFVIRQYPVVCHHALQQEDEGVRIYPPENSFETNSLKRINEIELMQRPAKRRRPKLTRFYGEI